jgi:hypothetical protein
MKIPANMPATPELIKQYVAGLGLHSLSANTPEARAVTLKRCLTYLDGLNAVAKPATMGDMTEYAYHYFFPYLDALDDASAMLEAELERIKSRDIEPG